MYSSGHTALFELRHVSPRPARRPQRLGSMMPGFLSLVTGPVLLLVSVPLATFAVLTTTIAFWILLFRVVLVYIALGSALLRAYISPASSEQPVDLPPRSPLRERAMQFQRSSKADSVGGAETPKRRPTKSESFASLVGPGSHRDFEGVGGWREAGDDEEEALWMGMNRRLELPSDTIRRHHRSSTGGSQRFSGVTSPEMVRTPLTIKTDLPVRRRGSGASSPESYFNLPLTSSLTTLDAGRASKVSFDDRRKSSSSSAVSVGSVGKITRRRPSE